MGRVKFDFVKLGGEPDPDPDPRVDVGAEGTISLHVRRSSKLELELERRDPELAYVIAAVPPLPRHRGVARPLPFPFHDEEEEDATPAIDVWSSHRRRRYWAI